MSAPTQMRPPQRATLLERAIAGMVARGARRNEGTFVDLAAQRASSDRFTSRIRAAKGVRQTEERIAGVPVVRFSSGNRSRGTVMFLHGGAYITGSARSVSVLAAAHEGPDVVSVNYRLSPEHAFPAAQDDAMAVYRALLTSEGPDRLVVQGDSAGGGLALTLLQGARDAGLPMPAALVAIYPWADLSLSGASSTTNRGRDILVHSHLAQAAGWFADGRDLQDPAVSPVFGSFAGFPATYIPVGSRDLLFDDARRVAARMQEESVEVRLDVFEGAVHGFNVIPLPMGRDCNARVRRFIDDALPSPAL